MNIINTILGIPLGYLMYLCYRLTGNYGIAIIAFTLLTKLLMLPLSLSAQKNALVMVRIQPALDDIKRRNKGNNTLIAEEQKALYRQSGYSTFKSLLPLLIQIPLILGLINVIYHPLKHLLHLDVGAIDLLIRQTAGILGISPTEMGSGGQLKVLELVQSQAHLFDGIRGVQAILGMETHFLGINLAQVPSINSITFLFPVLSGLSALALAAYQNKYYVLQRSQGKVRKWSMAIFLAAFSFFFAYILPTGIGLYWIAGNLLSIPVLTVSNMIYKPDQDSRTSEVKSVPLTPQEKAQARQLARARRNRQKVDKKRFAAKRDKQLVFYSEGSGFYKYFEGFIDHILDHSDLVIHYVTSDFQDHIFQNRHPRIETYYIGPLALIQFMMRMDADMVVMTTPDLESFHIKRSLVRKDIEYVYIDHGMASFHMMYRKGALDHFDTIFCYGPANIREVRETEKLYGLPPKRLVKTGYPLLDSMLDQVSRLGDIVNDPKVILIAPSWQKDNILEYCLDETLEPLLETGYRLVVRPHPEFVKRFPEKVRDIQARYGHLPPDRLEIQTDFSSNRTVYTADLVITDWSSIAQEFSYATKKPSLFINTPMKVLNPEYERIPLVPLDISLRDQIGLSVDTDQLHRLTGLVETLIKESHHYQAHISRLVSQMIFDIGDGARGGGDYIIARLKDEEEQETVPDPLTDKLETGRLEALADQLRQLMGEESLQDQGLDILLNQRPADLSPPPATNRDYLRGLIQSIEDLIATQEKGAQS
ncbi:MAG: membrane protein insertase YidC [Clostridiaceae bacterium]|jgi:YidC/Oxa1 family membrane protein insertase|nr:membrane protein insertase YidC [Clostridiaceae bacterium]